MSINTCPIAIVNAPVNRVWEFLSEPANYVLWWNAQTLSITPQGYAHVGQKVHTQTVELGRKWNANLFVDNVDDTKHHIDLTTELPFGIAVKNHISCGSIDNSSCRVSFG